MKTYTKLLLTLASLCLAAVAFAQTATAPSVVVSGSKATFTVDAIGTGPLTYTWYKQAPGASTWTVIAGQTGPVLSFAAVTVADSGSYRVTVSSPYGTATSLSASIDAGAAPLIRNFSMQVVPAT